jgi:HEAT repeat protein
MDREENLLQQAVEVARGAASEQDYEVGWALLREVAESGPASVRLGKAMLDSTDSCERAVGCDLLGLVAEMHPAERPGVADALLRLGETEQDEGVHWWLARALGLTAEPRSATVLARLASHADSEVRFQVALSLPKVWPEGVHAPEVLMALIALTADADPAVRDWATFGLGTQLAEADNPTIRDALWERTEDENPDVREEGICGLVLQPQAVMPGVVA